MGTISQEMYDKLIEGISSNGELIKKSEKTISDRIDNLETKYDQALLDIDVKYGEKIGALEEENKELRNELSSIRELIEGRSDNIKLSDKAVEGVVKQVATKEYLNLNTKVSSAVEKNNVLEQYTRNWCVRIYGVEVSKEREGQVGPVKAAIEAAYDHIVKPVLQNVVNRGDAGLATAPELENKLGKEFRKDGKIFPPCLIVRFLKREIRDIVMRNRKLVPAPTVAQVTAGVEKYRVVEDLTHINHNRLKDLIADTRVEKVWTIQGNFRIILKDDPNKTVIKCKGSLVNVEDSIKNLS